MSEEPKKKLPVRRLDLPRWLFLRQEFGFISRYPLDECARRLLAKNNRSFRATLNGELRIDSGIANAGMNTQQFALTAHSLHHRFRGWAVGTIADVDGEQTWVEGEVGITIAPFRKLLTVVLLIDVPILALGILGFLGVFGGLAIGIGFFLVLFYLLHVIHDIQHQLRLAPVRMHWHVGDIFGIRGEGPLPRDIPPAELVKLWQ